MMKSLHYGVLLLTALCILDVAGKDMETGVDGIFTKVHGKSGKISIFSRRKKNKRKEGITIQFDELKEIDANGRIVGKKGRHKHSFNSFAVLDFQFSPLVEKQFQNLSTRSLSFSAGIPSTNAVFKCHLYMFREQGEIEWGNETTAVGNATVKFNIEIKGWDFCNGSVNGCLEGNRAEIGKYLDTKICIKSMKKPKRDKKAEEERRKSRRKYKNKKVMPAYDLGDGKMEMPSGVMVDNRLVEMPSGYPMYTDSNNKVCFTLRLPKFASTVLYDPVLQYGDPPAPGNAAASRLLAWIAGLPVFIVIAYWF